MTPSESSSPTIVCSVKPPPAIDAWIGRKLKKYAIRARLGQGGMGVVYLAEDELLKRPVAIKLIAEALTHESNVLRRFVREARAAARLQHPNVVGVFEIDQEHGTPYLVMEFVAGPSAQQIVDRDGALPWRAAVQIVAEACRGLSAAHAARLIHRDVKPANLLVSRSGEVKIGDFGLAKVLSAEQTSLTLGNVLVGTPQYMSPEQTKSEELDERSDLYSLGATFYALLTGQPPFAGKDLYATMYAHATLPVPDPRLLAADIPEACVKIVLRAMAKTRADRFTDAQEMLAELTGVLGPQPEPLGPIAEKFELPGSVEAAAPITPTAVRPQLRRPRRWLQASLALLGAGFLIGGAVAVRHQLERRAVRTETPPAGRNDAPPVAAIEDSPEQLKLDLIARNPEFDGKIPGIQRRSGRIVKLSLLVDRITDIAPLGELEELEDLELFTSPTVESRLKDLAPLGRLQKITRLRVSSCPVDDFTFLSRWNAVTDLDLGGTKIKDLGLLSGLPLVRLSLGATRVQNLKGLENLSIEKLDLGYAYGLDSLEGLPTRKLRWLSIASTPVPNLGALRTAGELQYLDMHWAKAVRSQREEKPPRSLHPDDMAVLLGLRQLAEVTGEFTPAEEARMRKELPSLRVVTHVPPGKSS